MSLTSRFACILLLLVTFVSASVGQQLEIVKARDYKAPMMAASTPLKAILDDAVAAVVNTYRFKTEEIAVTVIDLRDVTNLQSAHYRGEEKIYPASVVKLFYLAALERQLEDKKVTMTAELERGLRDMIVDSSNEATQYILDVLTSTSSGAELPQKEFDEWQHKRNRVNRWFASMGYTNINVNQKTFCEDAYGIEQQSRAYKGQNRNMITTNATARLMAEIVTGNIATPERTVRMMNLLKRDPFAAKDANSQATDFIGKLLIDRKLTAARIWSKAGWTSKARHDVAYVETADGLKFVIAVYTENHADDKTIIPTIAGMIIDKMSQNRER